MDDPIAVLTRDRVVAILRDAPTVTLPLPELARRVGIADPDGLARILAPDPRVVLLGPTVLGLALADRADDYARALAAAGIGSTRRVALLHRTPPPAAGVAGLLLETTARLLAPDGHGQDGHRLAEVAERAHGAILATRSGASPSTTPLPGPPPPPSDQWPGRRRASRPPRRP